VHSKQYRKIF